MEILQLQVTGISDAIRSLFMSNKKYNGEIERKIKLGESLRERARAFGDLRDILKDEKAINDIAEALSPDKNSRQMYIDTLKWYNKMTESVFKITSGNLYEKSKETDGLIRPELIRTCHTTIGEFVDITATVSGLHRGATDDFDAHGRTLKNRIVRMSTRTRSPNDLEFSDWYKGKILSIGDISDIPGVNLPDEITKDGVKYVKSRFGYVRDDLTADYDVLRGLTPLGIANLFTFKCDIVGWAHITRLREPGSGASPELSKMIEKINTQLEKIEPCLNQEFLHYCIK